MKRIVEFFTDGTLEIVLVELALFLILACGVLFIGICLSGR
jgi:hypothetical protein